MHRYYNHQNALFVLQDLTPQKNIWKKTYKNLWLFCNHLLMFLLRERGTGIPNNENTPLVWMPNRERIFDHLSKNELSIGEESNKAYGLTETLV